MQYSYKVKNNGQDDIYATRLRLILKLGIDMRKTSKRYAYYMKAYLGILYADH